VHWSYSVQCQCHFFRHSVTSTAAMVHNSNNNTTQSNLRTGRVATLAAENWLICIADKSNHSAVGMLHPHHSATHYHTPMLQTPHRLQWDVPHSLPKLPLNMDQSPNSTICLIPRPIRPTIPNPTTSDQPCTRQTDQQMVGGNVRWL